MKKLYLGSTSIRRQEILAYFQYPFTVVPPKFDESSVAHAGQNPQEYAALLAKEKNHSLKDLNPEGVILTADTIVFYMGRIFEKPRSFEEAFYILEHLSGKTHQVITAVCVNDGKNLRQNTETTRVTFRNLDSRLIHSYLSSHRFSDKAAGYTIQNAGGIIVEKIVGCYYNVMGLPLATTTDLLLSTGIDLWSYLK